MRENPIEPLDAAQAQEEARQDEAGLGRAKRLAGLRRFGRDRRGVIYLEYLIVTVTVSFAAAAAIRALGPGLLNYHRDVVKVLLADAP
jgi:hypothetical protein